MVKGAPERTLELRTFDAMARPVSLHVVVDGKSHDCPPVAVVGRSESADVRLVAPEVSLFHVELRGTAHGVVVRDLGSRNGTHLGPVLVRHAVLPWGSVLTIAGTDVELAEGTPVLIKARSESFGDLVGRSPVMRELFADAERVAPTQASVLIEGPAGSGKTSLARAIHLASGCVGPLVEVACGALPPALAIRAFDGDADGGGWLEGSRGGSLFLKDVDELPRNAQLHLAERLGKTGRILATSRRELRELVNRGVFNEDLHRGLSTATLEMPGLERRRDDIPFLVHFFLGALPGENSGARSITSDALNELSARSYDGGAGELRELVERLAQLAPTVIGADDVAFERSLRRRPSAALDPFKEAKQSVIDTFERDYLAKLLERAGTNVSHAAAIAGIERHSLRSLLERHGLRSKG